ncbi:LysR family transcriptional regulator [Thalassococcus sp. S3]|uniref:LysR family transcriptional regulator n=1 Tax=Thalassococcus sp. S3 TaxID=2017482 RepID=UPI0010240550|nr:LysR family transcriptional regulator [Thalassococcus sp. S3]QBF32231.1 LysR family transcriptional regulator [Thalassococcus sp. S3]
MEPSWDDMRVFLAVARDESLSGAGKRLRLDPATVGRRVARLERTLGQVLFVKSPQGYRMTAAAERLMEHAARAEEAMRAGTDALAGAEGRLTGQVRIGAPDGCANYLLPQICAALGAENPDLDIQVVALPRVVNLTRREADMAITVSAPTAGQLVVQKISDYRLHLVAARRYLKRRPLRDVSDLQAHRMLGYIPDMIFDAELDYLAELGIARVPLASNSVPVQLRMAEQGAGLCMAHDFALPSHPDLSVVLGDQVSLRRAFYLVRHQSDRGSARLTRLAARISDSLRAEIARLEGCVDQP